MNDTESSQLWQIASDVDKISMTNHPVVVALRVPVAFGKNKVTKLGRTLFPSAAMIPEFNPGTMRKTNNNTMHFKVCFLLILNIILFLFTCNHFI